jgi:chemotaxis protein MotA
MDVMTLIGLVAGGATIYFVMASGNILHMLLNPIAALLVFGGTFSATLIAYPWSIIKHAIPSFRLMFLTPKNQDSDRQEMIDLITSLAEKARRQSVESLQNDLMAVDNRFLNYGMQMVIDGMDADVVRGNLEKDIVYNRHSHQKVCNVFRTMATLSPIFGLLGTLIGIVQVLRNLTDPTSMGNAMAIAITTTFYGIFAANFIFLPMSIKLNDHGENDIMNKELITEGVLAIQQGDLPLIVKKKLNAFLLTHMKVKGEPKKE